MTQAASLENFPGREEFNAGRNRARVKTRGDVEAEDPVGARKAGAEAETEARVERSEPGTPPGSSRNFFEEA